jgi:hypothetical protein
MEVESIHGAEGVLRLRCSGIVGIGSESTASMRPVSDAVAGWMRDHPDQAVREIVVDFTAVDYRWGDAPAACFIPFRRHGVRRVRFLAGAGSAQALESLFGALNLLPWFAVERADA